MKARNLFVSFMAVLVLCWSNVLLADDDGLPVVMDEITVNINQADAETLASVLSGIGISRAEAIIAYRESYGPFQAVDELVAVKGIGESLVNKNRKLIVLK